MAFFGYTYVDRINLSCNKNRWNNKNKKWEKDKYNKWRDKNNKWMAKKEKSLLESANQGDIWILDVK